MTQDKALYVTWERVALTAVAIALGLVSFIGRDLSKVVSSLDKTLTGFAAASTVQHSAMSKEIDSLEVRVEKSENRILKLETRGR